MIDVERPANAGFMDHLREWGDPERRGWTMPADELTAGQFLSLGTHPDLVVRLWDQLAAGLPRACRSVVGGRPALVHPETGVIFGFASGTGVLALRLPPAEREAARAAGHGTTHDYPKGRRVDVARIGREWVLGRFAPAEVAWCRAAYDFAGLEP